MIMMILQLATMENPMRLSQWPTSNSYKDLYDSMVSYYWYREGVLARSSTNWNAIKD